MKINLWTALAALNVKIWCSFTEHNNYLFCDFREFLPHNNLQITILYESTHLLLFVPRLPSSETLSKHSFLDIGDQYSSILIWGNWGKSNVLWSTWLHGVQTPRSLGTGLESWSPHGRVHASEDPIISSSRKGKEVNQASIFPGKVQNLAGHTKQKQCKVTEQHTSWG